MDFKQVGFPNVETTDKVPAEAPNAIKRFCYYRTYVLLLLGRVAGFCSRYLYDFRHSPDYIFAKEKF